MLHTPGGMQRSSSPQHLQMLCLTGPCLSKTEGPKALYMPMQNTKTTHTRRTTHWRARVQPIRDPRLVQPMHRPRPKRMAPLFCYPMQPGATHEQ